VVPSRSGSSASPLTLTPAELDSRLCVQSLNISEVRSEIPNEEVRYKLMRLLGENPETSQRMAARELGISLGKVNYCLDALIRKGWIKAVNFKNSKSKAAYMYLLTPRGIKEKTKFTAEFLQIKTREYEELRIEIEKMRREAAESAGR
jgi:EPS-associated MarR family transcriptional regulator